MSLEYIRTNDDKAVHESKPSFVDYFPHYKLQIFLLCVVVIIVAAYFWRKFKRFRRQRRREIERRTLLSFKFEPLDYCDCRILRQKSIPGAAWVKRQCPLHRTRPWTVANELQYAMDSRQLDQTRVSLDSGFHSPDGPA